jgi:hypothetical protein
MGQLLVTLIVPPIVAVVTYIFVRNIWERDENGAREAVNRREPSAVTEAEAKPTVRERFAMSAVTPKADIDLSLPYVRFVPIVDIPPVIRSTRPRARLVYLGC